MLHIDSDDILRQPDPIGNGEVASRLRILLIEDDNEDAALTLAALRTVRWFHADVDVRTTYSAGLAALRGRSHDVVLLDHRLGADTGLDLLAEAFGPTLEVPVVLLTGTVDHSVDAAATHAGVSHLLEKSELSAIRLERSIRYAMERARNDAEIRRTRAFFRAAFDSLTDHVAILDAEGTILAVNDAWLRFAAENGSAARDGGVGANYLDVCDVARGPSAEGALEVARGLRDVRDGAKESFMFDYPCHSAAEERWFTLKVSRFEADGKPRLLVSHENITDRRAAHVELQASEERHRLVSTAMREVVWDLDVASGRVILSGATQDVFGEGLRDTTMEWWRARIHPDDRAMVCEALASTLASGEAHWEQEYRLLRSNGESAYVSGQGYVLRDAEGVAVRVVGTTEDVTARRVAELAQRASEARYHSLIESAQEGICTLGGAGTISYANPRLGEMLGYAADELVGHSLFQFMPDEDQFEARTRFARRLRGIAETEEMRFRHRSGEILWILVSHSQHIQGETRLQSVLVLLTDITTRKHAELAISDALHAADLDRRRLEATLNAIPVGVWLADATGRLTHSNPEASAIWGGNAPHAKDVDGYGVYRAWNPATGVALRPEDWALPRVLASGETIANELVEIQRFDGERAFVLNAAAPIRDADGQLIGGVVTNVDVTERQAEAREREQLIAQLDVERSQLAALFEEAPSFLAVLRGPDHVFERVNPAYRKLVGDRELIGRRFVDAFPEMRGQGFDAILDGVRDSGTPFAGTHLPASLVREPGGAPETRYVTVVYRRMIDFTGEPLLVAHGWDATDEVLASEALRRNEQRLRDQFDKLPVPTTLWERVGNDDFVLLEANEEAQRADPNLRNGIGERGRALYPNRDEATIDCMNRCLRENTLVRYDARYDFGGAVGVRHYEMTFGPQQPARVIVHAVDTTGRVELEAQLRQAQKMEAVGQLAGGVAHDFNNLLTVIGVHSTFLLEAFEPNDPQREDAEAIHQAGLRAGSLTRQLLAFSRKQLLRPVTTDINTVVSEATRMLVRLIGEEVEFVLTLSNDLGTVVVDPGQIEQVLVNLAVNARDAMPAGGRLTITTRNVTMGGRGPAHAPYVPEGDYVLLEVGDTGIGMDEHTKVRIFEPFFTTKAPGKGTGLGLATVYGIVQQSAGYIALNSTLGTGTTFSIYLPRVATSESPRGETSEGNTLARGTETVLLVEDEPAVRAIAARVLERQGYNVLQARDGTDALRLSSEFDAPIHLVLSDAVMPGISGAETCRWLAQQRPNIKVVFMSGYTDDEVLRRGVVRSDVVLLEKPFDPAKLAGVVRETLDG